MLTAAVHMVDSTSPWLPPDRHHLMPPPPPATAGALHHHRRVAKRRPRPSRRQPTTYISADPANFRRMVHQVTGADDLPPPPPALSPPTELVRPVHAPLMLPTLDTSAFLLGGEAPVVPRTEAAVATPPCDGSLALVGGAAPNYNNSNSSGNQNGFPTLDSWDLL